MGASEFVEKTRQKDAPTLTLPLRQGEGTVAKKAFHLAPPVCIDVVDDKSVHANLLTCMHSGADLSFEKPRLSCRGKALRGPYVLAIAKDKASVRTIGCD